MLKRANKPSPTPQDVESFKKGADQGLIREVPADPIRRITHHIKLENWKYLKVLSAQRSTVSDSKVTINMLLDEAIELLKQKYNKE
jgi:hypothetical protein